MGHYWQERIADKFIDLLSKDNVISGQAIKNAEATHESQQKKKIVAEALPKAWNKIISELEDPLVNFLMETTENLCGHRVGYALAKQFIASNKGNLTLSEKPIVSEKLIKNDISIRGKEPPEDQTSSSRTAQMLEFLKQRCPRIKADHIGLLIEIDKKHRYTFDVDWEHTGREFLIFGKSEKHHKPANALKEVFGNKFTGYGNIARKKGRFVDTSKQPEEEIARYAEVEKYAWELQKQGLIYSPPKLDISVSTKAGTYFDSMDIHKQRLVEKNILQRRELWKVFLRNRVMTNADLKKYSKFKKKGTGGFSHFLTQNGIAQRSGGVLTLNKAVIPQIEELLRKYKS